MEHRDDAPVVIDPREVAFKMKLEYSRGVKDHTTKALEMINEMCWKLDKPDLDIHAFMNDIAEKISKHFGIASVAIAFRDPDGLYRYKSLTGLDKEVIDGFFKLTYTREEILNPKTYPSHEVSSHTKLFLSEEHPYAQGEEFTYRRPELIGMRRRSVTDSLEADYLDFFFYDSDGEILGFIEVSGTRLRQLPDPVTIKWIEIVASILGFAIRLERSRR